MIGCMCDERHRAQKPFTSKDTFIERSLVAQSEEQGSRKTTHGPLGLVADIPNIQQHGMLQQGSGGLLLTSHWLCS
ncbi:hypothetical protein MHYP_G00185050 [Metynnis hypsauchen]